MRILMTGGSGLIGRALAADLVEAGHEITVLTRRPQQARLPRGVAVHAWDARTLQGWAHLVSRADALINLAGESIAGENLRAILTRRWSPEVKERIRQSRLRVGHLLSEAVAAAERKPGVLIQASAVGYYGLQGAYTLTEEAPAGADFLAQVCQAWEDSTAALDAAGVRRVIVRTGLVLSRQGGILPVMLLPVRWFVGGPLGSGEQAVPWIHLADEVAAIRFLLEDETASGPYNLTAPQVVTQAEFVRTAAQLLHRPAWLPTPALALKLVLGEKAQLVLTGQRAVPQRLLEAGYSFRFPVLPAALQDLLGGASPKSR